MTKPKITTEAARWNRIALSTSLPLLCALAVLVAVPAQAGVGSLTLRINDAEAVPGGLAAVVLRTYAARPIGQGQVCFRAVAGISNPPAFGTLQSATVFSGNGDANSKAEMTTQANEQMVFLGFSSATASINESDGPLAVAYFAIDPSVVPGQTFQLVLDTANSFLVDEHGAPITIEARSGVLTIRAPNSRRSLNADGDSIAPGQVAELAFQTMEPFPVGDGILALSFDPAIAADKPTVWIDTVHGPMKVAADTSRKGLVIVFFHSVEGDYNMIPGSIVRIHLPTRSDVPVGTQSAVRVQRQVSELLAPTGTGYALRMGDGMIEFDVDTEARKIARR